MCTCARVAEHSAARRRMGAAAAGELRQRSMRGSSWSPTLSAISAPSTRAGTKSCSTCRASSASSPQAATGKKETPVANLWEGGPQDMPCRSNRQRVTAVWGTIRVLEWRLLPECCCQPVRACLHAVKPGCCDGRWAARRLPHRSGGRVSIWEDASHAAGACPPPGEWDATLAASL